MSLFGSLRRENQDIELSLPLYNSNDNRSSGFLSPSLIPTPRSTSPRPPEIRVPRPSTPSQLGPGVASPIPPIIRRRWPWRTSWQTIVISILALYALYSLFKSSGPVGSGVVVVAEYDGGAPRKDLTHLVIVAGHAIWMGGNTLGDDEKEWTLLPYQHGLAKTFKEHIVAGVKVAEENEDSLLMFTGGETRSFAGPASESQSYWSLAYLSQLIEPNSSLFNRSTTEEFARDSYENLLFSICRFYEYTSNYPTKITVVGFEFKRERIETVHRAAIRYPEQNFHYIGIDNTDDMAQLEDFTKGEKEGPLEQFKADPHGCTDPVLVSKKKGRNPFRTRHGYDTTCPDLRAILRWCRMPEAVKGGVTQQYTGELPWSKGS
ncbi:hypothetical protein H072_1937 [Dactylellina haptotyla CBS 200.50]|uniref:DUF218 domain-containing protein n=1 Tax=Dactylellina haptotyla (strain CBS 200.50) TaxID=1284197 RepID=S8AMD0_DACHA|nr:hypothetical protein H072_1937 [Dactylellina haptotyla CBS 200.50]